MSYLHSGQTPPSVASSGTGQTPPGRRSQTGRRSTKSRGYPAGGSVAVRDRQHQHDGVLSAQTNKLNPVPSIKFILKKI